jgi:hypothetical protein
MIDNNGKGQNKQTRQNSQAHIARKSVFPIRVESASKRAIPQTRQKLLCFADLRNPDAAGVHNLLLISLFTVPREATEPKGIIFFCFFCSLLLAPCSQLPAFCFAFSVHSSLFTAHCSLLTAPKGQAINRICCQG